MRDRIDKTKEREIQFLRDSVQRLHHMEWFNTHPRLVKISLAEHHYIVAVTCMMLLDSMPVWGNSIQRQADFSYLTATTLRSALVHDMEEGVTGDMNAVVKRNSGIRQRLREVSEEVYRSQVDGLPNAGRLVDDWKRSSSIMKFADRLSMWMYAIEEVDMGNTLMRQVCYTVEQWLVEMVPLGAVIGYNDENWLRPWVEEVQWENRKRGIGIQDIKETWRKEEDTDGLEVAFQQPDPEEEEEVMIQGDGR